jgi:putative transposase
MPRQARLVVPGIAHHVTQRGNYQQDVFDQPQDYLHYCRLMNKYAAQYRLDILAFCLMTNHVHFIVVPPEPDSLARVFNVVHMCYAQYCNKQMGTKGHLWQGRFYSCVLDDAHLYRALRYVERNPVRASMVKRPWEHSWSSAGWHLGREDAKICLHQTTLVNKKEWKAYLIEEDDAFDKEMRLKTQRGLAVGRPGFIRKMERKLKRSLLCRDPGRPLKKGRCPL